MRIARKALEDQGYEIVDFDITEEELAFCRKFIIGVVSTGVVPGTRKDCDEHGETMTWDNWLYYFLLDLPNWVRWLVHNFMN